MNLKIHNQNEYSWNEASMIYKTTKTNIIVSYYRISIYFWLMDFRSNESQYYLRCSVICFILWKDLNRMVDLLMNLNEVLNGLNPLHLRYVMNPSVSWVWSLLRIECLFNVYTMFTMYLFIAQVVESPCFFAEVWDVSNLEW